MAAGLAESVHVAVGVVTDGDGRVLITRRRAGAHQGGLWEFPGGKVEPGESVTEALSRELFEELGIRVHATRPLIQVPHDYDDKRVYLDVHWVMAFSGRPHGMEGQPLSWVFPAELTTYPFPVANRPIVAAIALPECCLVTPEGADRGAFLSGIEAALATGVGFVQLRRNDLSAPAFEELAGEVASLCRDTGALFAVNAAPDTALALGADACHLSGSRARALAGRGRPVHERMWLGVSCHAAEEIDAALALGCDYLFLSPVMPTASHPERQSLGWKRFAAMVHEVPRPVYALGGLGAGDLHEARRHGAHGVAAIRAFWPGSD